MQRNATCWPSWKAVVATAEALPAVVLSVAKAVSIGFARVPVCNQQAVSDYNTWTMQNRVDANQQSCERPHRASELQIQMLS